MKNITFLFAILLFCCVIYSCQQNIIADDSSDAPIVNAYDYSSEIDFISFLPFELRNEVIDLGKVIFYDEKISLNNSVSCATCHQQQFSFADNTAFSVGLEDKRTSRNSPAILNASTSTAFFWDMRETNLLEQVIVPITNHVEMGVPDMDYIENKIRNIDYYAPLFERAFGTDEVNTDKIAGALSSFVASLTVMDSKFDRRHSEPLSAKEELGIEIFKNSRCNDCHNVFGFFFDDFGIGGYTGGSFGDAANIGLDFISDDPGAGNGRFKVPTLRNLSFTAPYMHDGRFNTLDEVIDHYSEGIKSSPNLDDRLRENIFSSDAVKLNLTPIEKDALKAFLLTLNDYSIVESEMFSDPFKQ